jgi:DNA-binding transcriptional LysR family regulator
MDWNDRRYFLTVARNASLTQTASELTVSQSTVSQRVVELEENLSVVLFQRH